MTSGMSTWSSAFTESTTITVGCPRQNGMPFGLQRLLVATTTQGSKAISIVVSAEYQNNEDQRFLDTYVSIAGDRNDVNCIRRRRNRFFYTVLVQAKV
jgi:hypothetical protein